MELQHGHVRQVSSLMSASCLLNCRIPPPAMNNRSHVHKEETDNSICVLVIRLALYTCVLFFGNIVVVRTQKDKTDTVNSRFYLTPFFACCRKRWPRARTLPGGGTSSAGTWELERTPGPTLPSTASWTPKHVSSYSTNVQHFSLDVSPVALVGLCGYFCMPCQLRQNAGRLGEPAILFCLLHCFVPCLSLTMLRGKARNKYRIEGDVCEDAVVSWFCPCCTNVQIANEIKFRNA